MNPNTLDPTPTHTFHPSNHDTGCTTIITSQIPMPMVITTSTSVVSPTSNPVLSTGVSPSSVPTVPTTQQSSIPLIGFLSGLAVGGFLLTRLRK